MNSPTPLLASFLIGLTVSFVALLALNFQRCSLDRGRSEDSLERRNILRRASVFYRYAEVLIDELAETRLPDYLPLERIGLQLSRNGSLLPWKAKEFAAATITLAVATFAAGMLLGSAYTDFSTVCTVSAGLTAILAYTALEGLKTRSEQNMRRLVNRLPYTLDLASLAIAAGTQPNDALCIAANDNPEHPLSLELQRIVDAQKAGGMLQDALSRMDERLNLPEIGEMVRALSNAVKLGAPLDETFMQLADKLRLGKIQKLEANAAKSQVRIQGPSTLVLLACMISFLAPFIFELIREGAGQF